MTIGVLTFHGCINYGSYWQARCLVEGLRARGHDAVLLDHRSRAATSAEVRSAFQPQLPERTPRHDHPALGRKVRRFVDAIGRLPLSPAFPLDDPAEAGRYDAVVVGSDEVWNFSHPWYGAKPAFFGAGLRTDRLVSYAASFGNHARASGMDDWWAGLLRRFDALSVRDGNSQALVTDALGREPEIVLDPCLAFADILPMPVPTVERYAVLYGHGLPDWFARAARRWADAAGLRLVSIGYRSDLADEQAIDAGPLDFARIMSGASAVATNFFHGTVFALHYRKPFVAASSPYRRLKIEGLVTSLGAGHRLIDDRTGDDQVAHLMTMPLDPAIGQRIAEGRARSARFLDRALG